MGRLKTLPSRLQKAPSRELATTNVCERRITGRKLQSRRLTMWQRDPHCAACGRVVAYPAGFELDHIIPLSMGGEDAEVNCQLLCVHYDLHGGEMVKAGCHTDKTRADAL